MAFQTRRDTTNQLVADEFHKQYIRLSPTSIAFQNQRDTTYLFTCRRDSQTLKSVLSNVQSILKITDRKWFTCIAIVVILFEEPSSLDLSI